MEEMVPKEGSVAEATEAQAEIARKRRQGKRADIRTGFAEPIIFWVSSGKGGGVCKYSEMGRAVLLFCKERYSFSWASQTLLQPV